MEDVVELVARGQLEVAVESLDAAHCLEHGDRRAHGKELGDAEGELRVFDHDLAGAS